MRQFTGAATIVAGDGSVNRVERLRPVVRPVERGLLEDTTVALSP
jgi:hypothetical protein